MRQRLGDRGPVGRARIHRHDPHSVLPGRPALVQPGDDVGLPPPRRLAEQALRAGEVDEVGLEGLQLHPALVVGGAAPAGLAAAGLVDPQHAHRLGIGQLRADRGDERGVRGWPAQQARARRADRQPVADPVGHVPPQPPGHPRPGRHLTDLLGERPPRTRGLPAGVLDLVPAHRQRLLAVGQIPRSGGPTLPDAGGEHAALRARRRGLIVGDHVHHPRAVRSTHHLPHPQPGQAEQDRRTV
jgi:hypothetical protein